MNLSSTESPYFPESKAQFAWNSTSLGWLKACPRLYQYSMLEQWRSKRDSVHISFGSWFHGALESYDKLRLIEKKTHEDALIIVVEMALRVSFGWESDVPGKTRVSLIRSIIWYLVEYSNDTASTVVLANGKPAVELTFQFELTSKILLTGHLDRLVNFTGGVYVSDRKTTGSALGQYYFDKYDLDNQMTLYTLAGQIVYSSPVRGVIIDAVQPLVNSTRFARGLTYRTEAQLHEWINDTEIVIEQSYSYVDKNYWPQNPTACDRYGGCTFRKICSKSPASRQAFLENDFVKVDYNPLHVRNN